VSLQIIRVYLLNKYFKLDVSWNANKMKVNPSMFLSLVSEYVVVSFIFKNLRNRKLALFKGKIE